MRRTKVLPLALMVAFLALVIPTRGEEKEAPQKPATEEAVRKVIPLRYARPDNVARLLNGFSIGMITPDNTMKVVSVVGRASAVEAVEEAIKKLDVPPPPTKDVDLTAYFLLATRHPVEGTDVPQELHEVINQLKRVLNYQGFSLLNTALLRTQDGEGAAVSGVAGTGSAEGDMADFHFTFNHAVIVPEGKTAAIRIIGLDFAMERPGETRVGAKTVPADRPGEAKIDGMSSVVRRALSAKIRTDVDLPEGAKVVVGKTSFDSPDNAIVLVLTAKVVD